MRKPAGIGAAEAPDGSDAASTSNTSEESPGAPLGGTRAQAMQRLQVGLSGIVVMVLMIGLATIFTQRAQDTEDMSVPDAAPTTEPADEAAGNDPLVDAGVVPDLADEVVEEGAGLEEALTQELGEFGEDIEIEDTEAQ